MQTKNNGPTAAELTADAIIRTRDAHNYERDLRSETVRWAWAVAAWEMANTPPVEPIVLEGYDEPVVVIVFTDLVS